MAARSSRLWELGVRAVAVHTGTDAQARGATPLRQLAEVRRAVPDLLVSVAGGIHASTVDRFLDEGADVVVVGAGITHAADRAAATRQLSARVRAASR